MKTKTSFFYLWSFVLVLSLSPVPLALSQIPQGFNYQAIARDGTGAVLQSTTLQVRFYIRSASSSGTLFYQELHPSVTTNNFGLFTLVIGNGTKEYSSIDQIDWSVSPKYLVTEIYHNSTWIPMGSAQLYTVPYAMVAEDLAGTVKKLSVKGETSGLEEALFEVKNKDGQTVFAVYNEGVRVYVSNGSKAVKGGFAVGGFGTDKAESTKYLFVGKDSVRIYLDTNPLTKGKKSGFAVGGYDLTKGTVQNYLDISADSVRIYVDSDPEKTLKGGFAVGGYDMTKGTIQDYLDISSDSVRIYIDSDPSTKAVKGGFAVGGYDMTKGLTNDYFNVTSATAADVVKNERKVLWYPKKSALLGGEVHVGSVDSVGENSTALGYRSIAKGNQSQALGYRSIAYGNYSTAIGFRAESNTNSMAVGYKAVASGSDAFALGSGALAIGSKSFAFGSTGIDSIGNVTGSTKATGENAFAFGLGSWAAGKGAFAFGANDTASGNFSTSMGYRTRADGWYATAMGSYCKATNSYATAMGFKSKASAVASFANGYRSTASGDQSMAMGYYASASASNAIALGNSTKAQGTYSFAVNNGTISSGLGASSFGGTTTAAGQYAMATGQSTSASGWYSFAGGDGNTSSGQASLCVGKANSSAGYYSLVTGIGNTAKSMNCVTIGSYCSDPGTDPDSFVLTDPLFIAGNGYLPFQPSRNALILYKNGNMTIMGTLTQTSDIRLKNVISDLGTVLPQVLEMTPILFEFKDPMSQPAVTQIGFSAQEVQKYFPQLVFTDCEGYLSLDYSRLSVVLLKALKEQQELIESERLRNDNLEREISEINTRLKQLEKK